MQTQSSLVAASRESMGTWSPVSRLEDEDATTSCPSIESKRGFATGLVGPGNGVIMDSFLAEVAQRRGLLAIEDSVKIKLDRLLEE